VASFPPIFEGTLSAKPVHNTITGGAAGSVRGSAPPQTGSVSGDASDSPETSAVAELGTLIAALGSLSAQAGNLPLSPPTLPGLPQGSGYRPQATDYAQFGDDSN
jgi:hypothetical protein